ncbi:MAG: succinylglutamate desuccinylase/aspartoacylase family protein [Oligoflexia bacterium]|nr:succinylglutamate desuccinylase/aspartoacylase family protein [Oligoflexia bacterium]
MQSFSFGKSALGLAIPAYRFGTQGPRVLILGGVHGNEIEGTTLALALLEQFSQVYNFKLRLTMIPVFNVDGVIKKERLNGNGVDLNRNLPTKDWNPKAFDPKYPPGPMANSESESRALTTFLSKEPQTMIFSLHSWMPLLNVNGDCMAEAQAIKELTGYEIKEEIGYPTPGCLGTYAGLERNMPTLTYELERGLDLKEVIRVHQPAMLKALHVSEQIRRDK